MGWRGVGFVGLDLLTDIDGGGETFLEDGLWDSCFARGLPGIE